MGKRMKPAWDELMTEYKDSETVLIADVDCTDSGKALCETHGVQGFPTIKFGDPDNLETYEGGRDLTDLKKFASESLGPTCSVKNLELCSDEKKAEINKFLEMSSEDLEAMVNEKTEAIAKADKELEEYLETLQAQYEAKSKEADEKKAEIKNSGLSMMKSVASHKKKQKKEL